MNRQLSWTASGETSVKTGYKHKEKAHNCKYEHTFLLLFLKKRQK